MANQPKVYTPAAMAGISKLTKPLTVRVPLDLLERVDAAGARTDIMVAALQAYLGPGESVPDERVAMAERRGAELMAQLEALQAANVVPLRERSILPDRLVYGAADPTSAKAVAAVLPVTGSQFPRQLTYWQKRELAAKGKKRPE